MPGLCKIGAMVLGARDIDQLCEFAIDFLLSGRGDAKELAAALVMDRPDRSPLEVIFVMSSAAASIEEVLAGEQSRAVALDAWRMASLLAVDLHMMQVLQRPNQHCHALLAYWQTEDPFFLGRAPASQTAPAQAGAA